MITAEKIEGIAVWAEVNNPADAETAKNFGVAGVFCPTEQLFNTKDCLPITQQMISATLNPNLRTEYLEALEQLSDHQLPKLAEIMKIMRGISPAKIVFRLLNDPLQKFLSDPNELLVEVIGLNGEPHSVKLLNTRRQLETAKYFREQNPELGLRGARLGEIYPEIPQMQVSSIIKTTAQTQEEGFNPHIGIVIPNVTVPKELIRARKMVDITARATMQELRTNVNYELGAIIGSPKAVLEVGKLIPEVDFLLIDTDMLTQTTLSMGRQEADGHLLEEYTKLRIFPANPFQVLDIKGVGKLVKITIEEARRVKPALPIGVFGEHTSDPDSIEFFQQVGVNFIITTPDKLSAVRQLSSLSEVL